MAYLHACGCQSIYLDGEEPAVRLYERLGSAMTNRQFLEMRYGDVITLAKSPREAPGERKGDHLPQGSKDQ
jgi:hypothetical protein